jgi:hypothetical protein
VFGKHIAHSLTHPPGAFAVHDTKAGSSGAEREVQKLLDLRQRLVEGLPRNLFARRKRPAAVAALRLSRQARPTRQPDRRDPGASEPRVTSIRHGDRADRASAGVGTPRSHT